MANRRELAFWLAGRNVPKSNSHIISGRQKELPVKRRRNITHPSSVPLYGFDAVTIGDIPQSHIRIPACTGKKVPRWYKTNSADNVFVILQGPKVLVTIRGIPQLDRKVRTARSQENPAGCVAIINVPYRPRMPFECRFQFAIFPVPDLYCGIVGARRD
jgi:hypothetical protein